MTKPELAQEKGGCGAPSNSGKGGTIQPGEDGGGGASGTGGSILPHLFWLLVTPDAP